ncbi:MFS sugar transporter [Colletotrichum lupini]|nr:MFS sugar transporter [Colletotrichum lupini]
MGKLITIFSGAFLAIGGFLFGYDSGIISSTLAQEHFIEYFGGSISDSEAGGIVSSFTGGAIIGCLVVSFLADVLGRRLTVFTGSVTAIFGCALQAGATTVPMLIAGRLIAGLAVGILSAVTPMYCSEIAQADIRGALSGLLQWMLSWGFFVAQWLGYGCSHVDSHFQWRFPLAFQVAPAFLMAVGIWFLSESPRWLIEKERYEEARLVLKRLHGNGDNDDFLEAEYQEIHDTIIADRSVNAVHWKALFTRPSWRRRLLLGCGVQAFGQLSGVNVINYYGPRIYESLGIDNQTSLMIIGISGSLSIVWCSIGLWALERIGRVKPLIFSAVGCGLALVVNAVLSKYLPTENGNQLRAMVAMNFVFSFFFTMTGIISWVYPAEIFPIEIRAKGNAIATLMNWSLNLVFAQVSPLAFTSVGFRYFFAFFVFNLCAALSYGLFYPETAGRTLEQMDVLFGDATVAPAGKESGPTSWHGEGREDVSETKPEK